MEDVLRLLFFFFLYVNHLARTEASWTFRPHHQQPQTELSLKRPYATSPHLYELQTNLRYRREATHHVTPFKNNDKEKKPIVNHHRISPITNEFSRRRAKRNVHSPREKQSRFIDYDGWSPMDVSDPMSNQPTLYYQPPTLTPVHFGEDPPSEEPLYPIVPKNPPVIVIRAAHPPGQIDRIYGTEKINYVHIDPSSNLAEAFESGGKANDIKLYEVYTDQSPADSSPNNFEEEDNEFTWRPRPGYHPQIPTQNVQTISKHNNIEFQANNPNRKRETDFVSFQSQSNPNEQEFRHTFSEVVPLEREVEHPILYSIGDDKSNVNNIIESEQTDGSLSNQGKSFSDVKIQARSSVELNPTPVYEDPDFSEKALHVDDVYYYYDEVVEDYVSPDAEDLQASGSDPFSSILPVDPSEANFQGQSHFSGDVDNQQAASEVNEEKILPERRALHELLRGFNGVKYDRYIFSASENDERSILHALPPSDFRFKQKSLRKLSSKNEPFKNFDEPNFRPWYLIRTRSESPRKSKKSSQFLTKGRRLSGSGSGKRIFDSFTKKENAFKPSKPADLLTANSLSELLQIFRYVTTPSPITTKKRTPKVTTKAKEFRYTQPTESPFDQETTKKTKVFTTFRYTLPTSKLVPPTESPFETTTQAYDLPDIPPPLNDSVIDTNSIDGYLFSESENAPEYSKPELLPNAIRIEEKTPKPKTVTPEDSPKDISAPEPLKVTIPTATTAPTSVSLPSPIHLNPPSAKKTKMDHDAHRRGEVDHRLTIDIGNVNLESRSLDGGQIPIQNYFIHQGHSKVKVFGGKDEQPVMESNNGVQVGNISPQITSRNPLEEDSTDSSYGSYAIEPIEKQNDEIAGEEQSSDPSLPANTESIYEYSDYEWLQPDLDQPHLFSGMESQNGTSSDLFEEGFLPSAFEALTRLFYSDLTPTEPQISSSNETDTKTSDYYS